MRAASLLMLGLALTASQAGAQDTIPDPHVIAARIAEHAHDFDYLLGDWEFTATDATYGTYGG